MSYRPNADTLGESVISFDVVVQLCDGSLPQVSAVVGFIYIHDGYRRRKRHAMKNPLHAARFTCCGRPQVMTSQGKHGNCSAPEWPSDLGTRPCCSQGGRSSRITQSTSPSQLQGMHRQLAVDPKDPPWYKAASVPPPPAHVARALPPQPTPHSP